MRHVLCGLLMAVVMGGDLSALEVNRAFSDNMVLQRDKPITVRGASQKGEKVSVVFDLHVPPPFQSRLESYQRIHRKWSLNWLPDQLIHSPLLPE